MMLSERQKRNINNKISATIKNLRTRYSQVFVDKIIGINYILANIYTLKEMSNSEIFTGDDYYKDEDGWDIGLSRKFLFKRLRSFNKLLSHIYRFDSSRLNDHIPKQERELSDFLLEIESDGRIEWINRSGLYSFYKGLHEGFITYGELGEKVEEIFNESINSE